MRILSLLHPGSNSRGLLLDLMQGARELGHEVLEVDLGPTRNVFAALQQQGPAASTAGSQMIHQLIERNRVDLTVAMWSNGVTAFPITANTDGTYTTLLDLHGHPLLSYWWDAPHWASSGQDIELAAQGMFRGAHQLHCINNPGTGAEMSSLMGFRNVIPQANGVCPQRFRPQAAVQRDHDLVFISGAGDPPPTPVMLEELTRDEPDVTRIRRDMAGRLAPELDRLASGFAGELHAPMRALLDALVEARLAHRHRPALAHLQEAVRGATELAPAAKALLGDVRRYHEATDTIRRIDKWERPFMVAYLSRHFRCLRVGHQSYDAWGVEGAVEAPVDYAHQSAVYARARFALNVSRWQDDLGVNSKIFEITASGTACLQAYRGGVEELFDEEREILVFRSPGEARDRLADALRARAHEPLAEAGRARTLRDHTWTHRMERVLGVLGGYWRQRGRRVETRPRVTLETTASSSVTPSGQGLAFILAPMRSGSTLLRKILSGHPRLASPPETWFLLPLLDLWQGSGDAGGFNRKQAAVGLQTVADRETFLDACRAFAAQLYSRHLPPGGACVIDKTPMYLKLADLLVELFPDARFIVLARDPRGTVWSLHTWDKLASPGLDALVTSVGPKVRTQYAFTIAHPDRTHVVRYEDLCERPQLVCMELCRFLGTTYDPRMLEYGTHGDATPGYGDEKTLAHGRAHTASVRRWGADLTVDLQQRLAEGCTSEALCAFGYDELAARLAPAVAA